MSAPTTTLRPSRVTPWLRSEEARERSARRRVMWAWGMLLLNTLTYFPRGTQPVIVPIPSTVGKLITQGSLGVALLLALSVNRRIVIRPNFFLCIITLLAISAFISAGQAAHFGTIYRTFRLAGFVATCWLLTPWWGRRDLLLVRAQLAAAYTVLGAVLVGLILAPHTARNYGRLGGALWPTPPTQVAEWAAVTTGIVIVLWLGGVYPGRLTLIVVTLSMLILLMTHTRTALVAMIGALIVASLSLFAVRARVRKLFTGATIAISVIAITASGFVTTWLARGENSKELSDLTGRTTVWSGVLNAPRDRFQDLFGFGLSNKSFNGLPIDSNWMACYNDQGLVGVVLSASAAIFLLVLAFFRARGVPRSLGLFLVTYCTIASFTEVGFSDASTYLMYMMLAGSLLVPRTT
jgi:hypothetical protein